MMDICDYYIWVKIIFSMRSVRCRGVRKYFIVDGHREVTVSEARGEECTV